MLPVKLKPGMIKTGNNMLSIYPFILENITTMTRKALRVSKGNPPTLKKRKIIQNIQLLSPHYKPGLPKVI